LWVRLKPAEVEHLRVAYSIISPLALLTIYLIKMYLRQTL
jgi:hypothetical protein